MPLLVVIHPLCPLWLEQFSVAHLRRDVPDELQVGQRGQLLDRQSPDDHLCGLRIENDFEAKFLELRHRFVRFVGQPDLNLSLAVVNEFRFIGPCYRLRNLESINYCEDRRMKLRLQLGALLLLWSHHTNCVSFGIHNHGVGNGLGGWSSTADTAAAAGARSATAAATAARPSLTRHRRTRSGSRRHDDTLRHRKVRITAAIKYNAPDLSLTKDRFAINTFGHFNRHIHATRLPAIGNDHFFNRD